LARPKVSSYTVEGLARALTQTEPLGFVPLNPDDPWIETINPGIAEGELAGGCLTLLAHAVGTPDQPVWRDKIVFLEDVNAEPYEIDANLTQLLRAGVFDGVAGTATFLPNLPGNWAGTPVREPVAAALGAGAVLVNDARAFAVGESRLGAASGRRTALFVTVGTGVGGGVVVDGRLHLGIGTAGEFGHQTVDPAGPVCGCGNRGCVEAVACAGAIAAAAECGTVEEAVEAAQSGDEQARAALEQAGRALGIALANAVLLLAPERIVVGGGVAGAGDLLLDPIRDELRRRVRVAPIERIDVVPAELGPGAGAIGAALWAAECA
jgi:glucokinase